MQHRAFFVPMHYNLSSVSWNLINGVGLNLSTNYAVLKRAYPSSVIFFDHGYNGAIGEGRRRGLPWKSHIKFKKVIEEIVQSGLAYWEGTRLVLTPKKESAENHSKKSSNYHRFIKLDRSADIKPQLAAALLKSKVTRISFAHNSGKSQNKKTVKQLVKMCRGFSWGISMKQLAKLWGVSSTSAKRILTQISEDFGLFVQKSERKLVMFATALQWETRNLWWNDKKNGLRCDMNSCYWNRGIIHYQGKTRIGIAHQV